MTDAEFTSLTERIAELAGELALSDTVELTAEERLALRNAPEDVLAIMEEQLAAYTVQSEDIRTHLALKGVAQLLVNLPVLADAVRIGYGAEGAAPEATA